MKSIVCGKCFDVRALRGEGEEDAVTCECGNVTAWWRSPLLGTVTVRAKDRDKAKILGIHNDLLQEAFTAYDFTDEKWKRVHDRLAAEAEGYLFKTRGCPFVLVGIGRTGDVKWADDGMRGKE